MPVDGHHFPDVKEIQVFGTTSNQLNMEVIHISPSYKPAYKYGGPTVSVSQLCETLQILNLKLQVLTTTANGTEELAVSSEVPYLVAGVPVRYFSRITGDHSHLSPGLLWHLIKLVWHIKSNNEPCIIHIHSWWNLVAILSCLVGRIFKLTIIISPRGMLTSYSFGHNKSLVKRCLHTILGKWLLEGSHLHATSEKEKRDILTFVKAKSVVVIPNLINLPAVTRIKATPVRSIRRSELTTTSNLGLRPKQDNSRRASPFKLLFFSRIDKKKGIELLIQAVASLSIDFTLTIAGSGDEKYLQELLQLTGELGVGKQVRWTGHIPNSDKFEMLQEHDLLVLPSLNENFANVVIESLAVGTAVLVSEDVGLADYLKSSQLGWVSTRGVSDLAMRIEAISKQQDILSQIRLAGPWRIASDFHQEVLATKYMNYYKQLIVS
jgi:glycosyltransferase involved in cell wall biosynthesis